MRIIKTLLIFVCLLLTTAVYAEEVHDGMCGVNLKWSFDSVSCELTISGDGDMYDYDFESPAPWDSYTVKKVALPKGLTSIGDRAFTNIEATSVDFPKNLKRIGKSAFSYCDFTEIYLPKNLTKIGEKAFYGCYDLMSVTLPDSIKRIENGTFSNCGELSNIKFPEGLIYIGKSAFYGCNKLYDIVFPESLEYIGEEAFYSCMFENAATICIPENISYIGDCAFTYCNVDMFDVSYYNEYYCDVDGVLFNEDVSILIQYPGGRKDYEYEIPQTVKKICDYAFYRKRLFSITIHEGLDSICDYAFCNCDLKSVTLPKGLKYLGQNAFLNCSYLESVSIGEDITNLENSVFSNCSKLKSVIFPESLISIGESAFYATAVDSILLPEQLEYISSVAFGRCRDLTTITIPSKVSYIGSMAFWECKNLQEVICLSSKAPQIDYFSFEEISANAVLVYPEGCDYSSWLSYFGQYRTAIDNIEDDLNENIIEIYSLNGTMIYKGCEYDKQLPKGVYVLIKNNISRKLYIK